jgi:hypothetical protein
MSERDESPGVGETSQPEGARPDYEAPGAAARVSENAPPDTNQPSSEPIPADEHESAPPHSNLSSTGAQSPNPPAVSATGVGAPRPAVTPRAAVAPEASRAPGMQGDLPAGSDVDLDTAGERAQPGSPPASVPGAADSRPGKSGNAHGVSVAATESMAGTSQDSMEVGGIAAAEPQEPESQEPAKVVPTSPDSQAGGATPGGTSRAHRRSAPDGEVSSS